MKLEENQQVRRDLLGDAKEDPSCALRVDYVFGNMRAVRFGKALAGENHLLCLEGYGPKRMGECVAYLTYCRKLASHVLIDQSHRIGQSYRGIERTHGTIAIIECIQSFLVVSGQIASHQAINRILHNCGSQDRSRSIGTVIKLAGDFWVIVLRGGCPREIA